MTFHYRRTDGLKADPSLQCFGRLADYARQERLPWRRDENGVCTELRVRRFDERVVKNFPLRSCAYVPRSVFQAALRSRFENEIKDAASNALHRAEPTSSAYRLLSGRQKLTTSFFILLAAAFFAFAPLAALIAFNTAATLYFLAAIFFRIYLTIIGYGGAAGEKHDTPLCCQDLPVATVLLPVYDEAEGLPLLSAAIGALDYPSEKLDVKLLLEEEDKATIEEARRLGLHQKYDCIIVPDSEPRTKPKACNYGLQLARGDLIVIYDAEDAPEPDQLRKAAAAFAAGNDRLACMQARLNYYNADENWLTRLFAIEYALWFDTLLPALEKLKAPIPLGGTSNIFRTRILRDVGGWDPYNVTEDADLGLRLARRGYQTEILDSTTLEEANCRTGNWIRQRSRWMKGYMQTWLVHMRSPGAFFQIAGWRGFVATQLFVAGNFVSALINPFLWALFAFWLWSRSHAIAQFFPGPLLALNLFALLAGNAFFIYLGVIAPLKRGWAELSPHALLAPAYWWLTSVAAYKALWQLFTRPSFWEKTDHVLSAAAKEKRGRLLHDRQSTI